MSLSNWKIGIHCYANSFGAFYSSMATALVTDRPVDETTQPSKLYDDMVVIGRDLMRALGIDTFVLYRKIAVGWNHNSNKVN